MRSTSGEIFKELRGDGLRINIDSNDLNLRVSGDGCRVTVTKNNGKIRVVGDGCSLKVNRNDGKIEYKGDGGNILLGKGSDIESVSYVGDGGSISVKSAEKKLSRNLLTKKTNKLKKTKCDSLSDTEIEIKFQNDCNEKKEEADLNTIKNDNFTSKRKCKNNLQRSKTIVVTKISSDQIPSNNFLNNNLIKNWFRNPPSVIKSFKSTSEGRESI